MNITQCPQTTSFNGKCYYADYGKPELSIFDTDSAFDQWMHKMLDGPLRRLQTETLNWGSLKEITFAQRTIINQMLELLEISIPFKHSKSLKAHHAFVANTRGVEIMSGDRDAPIQINWYA